MLSVLCAVLLFCSVGLLGGTKIKTANAASNVDEILLSDYDTRSDGKMFNGAKLAKIYDNILQETNTGTFEKVKNKATQAGTTLLNLNFKITFADKEWYATYLSESTDGDVVLTLWLADSFGSVKYSNCSSCGGNHNNMTLFPDNMYGTSYVRAVINNGQNTNSTDSDLGKSAQWGATSLGWQISAGSTAIGTEFEKFTTSSVTGNVMDYIVTPGQIVWQATQNAYTTTGIGTTLNNDSYDSAQIVSADWSKLTYAVDYCTDTRIAPNAADWQNDKIWLPSIAETGYDGAADGLWKTTVAQRTGSTTAWARSASWQNYNYAYYLRSNDGSFNTTENTPNCGTTSYAVRPAIHLNLTKANDDSVIEIPVPQNVAVDYDGNSQWIDTLETLTNTNGTSKFPWIDTSLHDDTSIVTVKKIEYTNYNVVGEKITEKKDVTSDGTANIRNAGLYEVTLEIPSTSTDYAWRGASTGEKKFTITINQTSVPYTLQILKGSNSVTSVDYKDSYTSKLNQTAVNPASPLTPLYELWYKGVSPTVYADSKTAPTDAGKYTLSVKAKDDPANAGKKMPSNYKLTGSALNFEIKAKEITKLTAPSKQTYDGSTKTFTVNNYDTTIMTAGKVDASGEFETGLPTGLTETATHTFEATNAGKYTVAFRLPLDSADGLSNRNYKWTGETDSFITVDIEVEQRTLEFEDWPLLSGQTSWTIPVTATGALSWNYSSVADKQPVSGESVKLQYRFYYTSDGDATASTPTDSLDVKDIHDKNGATSRPQGNYTVELVIADNTAAGGVDGKNYKLGTNSTLTITLGAGTAEFDKLIKQVAIGTALPVDYDGLANPLEYTIADGTEAVVNQVFTLGWPTTIDYVTLGSAFGGGAYKYEKWNGSSWVNASNTNGAGKYKVTVSLAIASGKDFTFDSTLINTTTAKGFKVESVSTDKLSATISFEVEIAKKTIDTSDFKLQYSYDQNTWKNFDTEYKTEYVGLTIYVRVNPDTMKPSVAGITAKFGTSDYATGKDKKVYPPITASFTLTDNDNFTISDKAFTWEITNKQIKVDTNADWEPVDFSFDGVDYIGELMGIKGHSTYYPDIIEYEYSWYPESNPSNVQTGTGDAAAKAILTTASDTNKIKVTITVKVKSSVTDYDLVGNAQTCAEFTVGSDKTPITAATAGSAVYGDLKNAAGFGVSVTDNSGANVAETGIIGEIYAVYLHKYNGYSIDISVADSTGTLLKDVDFANLDAGVYVIEVRLSALARESYSLKNGKSLFEIEPKAIDLPTIGEIIFTGGEINLIDHMTGFDANIMEFVAGGDYEGLRDVSANGYSVQIKLKDANYCWKYDGNDKVKAGYSLSDYEINKADASTAVYKWNISPLVIDTSKLWNKGKNGATLNLPQNVKDLIAGGTLELGYKYYDAEGNFLENPEIKGNKQFKVEAVFGGEDAERNVQFKTGDTTIGNTSPAINYTVPQSGATAFFGNTLSFLKSNWLWFLIGFLVLLFLIILIVLIAKRRKNKEEREEKKRKKEEEKERREEEKRRREEEREAAREKQRAELEAAKAKQQAELELAKAKQEAELAKMKAEAAAAAGMAGAAGMAMAAQPQQAQQPAQQPVAQQAQQPAQQQSMPQPQPVQQYPQQQAQQPYYMPQQPAYDAGALARLEAELHEMRKEQRSDGKLENELLKLRLDMGGNNANAAQQSQQQPMMMPMGMMPNYGGMPYQQPMMFMPVPMNMNGQQAGGNDESGLAEKFGQMMASMMKSMGVKPQEKPVEIQVQSVEAESQPTSVSTPTVYPPDAVVTTTTTVDTTKKTSSHVQPRARRSNSDDGRMFDIDGFYDAFDENK